jgi:peptidoglycan/xylan/chitin deacetylase (PgdA/CDA1 family)
MSILCYHAVDPEWRSPLAVTPEEFGRQMAWLAASRTVVPLSEALRLMDRRGRLPRGLVALTFDDGFVQLHDFVFPVLAEHDVPATVFLVAATLTEEGQTVDWVDTPPDWQLDTLDLDQVREARRAGVEFGSHSWSHRTLTELEPDECREDLARSRALLSDLLHAEVPYLAYPRGRHDAGVRRAAADAGFSTSFGLPEQREPVTAQSIPRVGVFPGNDVLGLRVKSDRHYLRVRHSSAFPALRGAARALS